MNCRKQQIFFCLYISENFKLRQANFFGCKKKRNGFPIPHRVESYDMRRFRQFCGSSPIMYLYPLFLFLFNQNILVIVLKNRTNEIRSNEIRIRRELPVLFAHPALGSYLSHFCLVHVNDLLV